MKKTLKKFLSVAVLFTGCCLVPSVTGATTFTIDSLDGDITSNELNQFVNSVATLNPGANNYGNNYADHTDGVRAEGIGRMYEATDNVTILNHLIRYCEQFMSHRNDQPWGEHRTMWDGTVAAVWPPEASTDPNPGYAGSESCQVGGHVAYCAWLILSTPSIWNNTVPDGNPHSYGATYKARAQKYVQLLDGGMGSYYTKWFVTSSHTLRWPTDSRWGKGSGGDTQGAAVPWNQQMMFCKAYQYLAQCHDILGDNPSFLSLYKDVVNQFATGFVAAQTPYVKNGHNVCTWGYSGSGGSPENQGHAQHDVVGLWQSYESGYTGVTSSQVGVYANTAQYVMNLGSTDSWSGNVDGTGTSSSLKTDFIFLSMWNNALFKMIAQANIDANLINSGSEACKNTGYILYMKHWLAAQIDTSKIYKLQNVASGLVLNQQGSLTNGSKITQWSASSTSVNLQWKFLPTSSGYYQINSVKSGRDVVVQSASTASGAKIIQWSFGSAGNDQWQPVDNGDGTWTLV
ncbi:MAG TPA: RICIN domain-containing protein, partial [Desulfuromonadaceae bacterium]|nr:RICIN domain-containing protein [Desulfuromonadaceae bacterium]